MTLSNVYNGYPLSQALCEWRLQASHDGLGIGDFSLDQ